MTSRRVAQSMRPPAEAVLLSMPALGSSIEIGNHREGGTYSQDAHGAGNQQHRHHGRTSSSAVRNGDRPGSSQNHLVG